MPILRYSHCTKRIVTVKYSVVLTGIGSDQITFVSICDMIVHFED